MTAPLDEKGLEAALTQAEKQAQRHGDNTTCSSLNIGYDGVRLILAAARAYLAASPSPSEMEVVPSDLVERLRATRKAISYGVDAVEVDVAPSMLDLEAADAIELTQSALAAIRAEREEARLDRITAERDAQNMANQLVAAEARIKDLEEALREISRDVVHTSFGAKPTRGAEIARTTLRENAL